MALTDLGSRQDHLRDEMMRTKAEYLEIRLHFGELKRQFRDIKERIANRMEEIHMTQEQQAAEDRLIAQRAGVPVEYLDDCKVVPNANGVALASTLAAEVLPMAKATRIIPSIPATTITVKSVKSTGRRTSTTIGRDGRSLIPGLRRLAFRNMAKILSPSTEIGRWTQACHSVLSRGG